MSRGKGLLRFCQACLGPAMRTINKVNNKNRRWLSIITKGCPGSKTICRYFCGRSKTIPQTDQLGTPMWSEILRFEADKQHIPLDLLFPTKPGCPNERLNTSFVSDTRAATPPPPKCGSCEGHGRITEDEAVGRPVLGPVSLLPRAFHGLRVAEYQLDRRRRREQSWTVQQQPG